MTLFSRLLCSLVVAAFVSVAQPAVSANARQPAMAELWNGAEIEWREIGPGVREATRTGKPVIMLFHASWCPSCKQYRQVWKDAGVVEASRNFVMILVDVDKDPGANGAFSPDGTYVPRTLFLDSDGNVQSDVAGADPQYPHSLDISAPDELRSLMQKAADKFATKEKRTSND
jgi:protein-disulfide reductase (glutathione)